MTPLTYDDITQILTLAQTKGLNRVSKPSVEVMWGLPDPAKPAGVKTQASILVAFTKPTSIPAGLIWLNADNQSRGYLTFSVSDGLSLVPTDNLTAATYVTNVSANQTLTPATSSAIGGVKVGPGLSILSDGTLSATGNATVSNATTTSLGIVQLAGDLSGTATAPTVPALANKQATLVSGTNIKTVGSKSLVGSGDLGLLPSDIGAYVKPGSGIPASDLTSAVQTNLTLASTAVQSIPTATSNVAGVLQLTGDLGGTSTAPTVPGLASKQATLVSGTNLRTVGGNTLLGSTDIPLPLAATTTPVVASGAGTIGALTTRFALADHAHPVDTTRAPAAVTSVTAARHLTPTTLAGVGDSSSVLMNTTAADITVQIDAGLGSFEIRRGATNDIIVTTGTGTTAITGNLRTTLATPRVVFTETASGVYRGDAPHVYFQKAGFSMIGDSRTADLISGVGTNSRNWFNQACSFYKQYPILVNMFGVSGNRSDQYLTNGNFELALADSAEWLIFGYPAVNDISQAPYTDTFGNSVTLATVATFASNNILTYAQKAVAAGKKVIVLTEPGSTAMNAGQTAQVHEFNRMLKLGVQNAQGILLYDPCPLIWNPTGSATIISKKANYSGDGTHAQQPESTVVGTDFATNFLPSILPKIDTLPASISDTVANGTNQIFRNPLFNTLTGGTNGGNLTLTSGTVPSSCVVSCSAAIGASLTITSAANANGYGNDVTFALTATAAGNFRLDLLALNADWQLTDTFESRCEMDIAAGSTALGLFTETYVQTNIGTNEWYCNYSGASGPMSTAAFNGVVYRTRKGGCPANSTAKSGVQQRITVVFGTGGGSITFTVRRPATYRYP